MQYSTFITFFDIMDFSSSTYDFSLPGFHQINVFCVIFFLPILVFHNKKIYHPKEDNKDSSSILRLGHLTIAIARAITPSFSPIQHTLFACPSMHPSSLSLSLSHLSTLLLFNFDRFGVREHFYLGIFYS